MYNAVPRAVLYQMYHRVKNFRSERTDVPDLQAIVEAIGEELEMDPIDIVKVAIQLLGQDEFDCSLDFLTSVNKAYMEITNAPIPA